MYSEDSLIGPATLSELRKTIAICTQTHQTNLQIVPAGCYTDGNTIFVCPPPQDLELVKRWILLEAVTIHESWHILFESDFQLLRKFVEKYEKKYKKDIPFIGKIAHDIVNIVEDSRIEYLGKKRFLGTKSSILFNNVYWLRKRPSFKGMKDWQMLIEGLLQLGVCGGLKEPIPSKKVDTIVRAANFYLHWAKIDENSKASFLAAEKIMDLLLTHFKIKGSYSQQVISPPNSVGFKGKEKSSDKSSKDVPKLPKEIQKELENLPKEQEENQEKSEDGKDSEKNKSDKEDKKSAEAEKSSTEGRERGDDKGQSNGEEEGESKGQKGDQEEGGDEGQARDGKGEGEQLDDQEGGGEEDLAGDEEGGGGGEQGDDQEDSDGKGKGSGQGDNEGEPSSQEQSGSAEDGKGDEQGEDGSSGRGQGQKGDENGEVADKSGSGSGESQQAGMGGKSGGKEESAGDGKGESLGRDEESDLGDIDQENTSEVRVVNIDEIDPMKSGLISPAAIRIKIDDLVKRNYNLLRDRDLQEQAKEIVKALESHGIYKDVFYTKTFDIGVEIELNPSSRTDNHFQNIYNSLRSLIQVTINQFKALFKSGSKTTSRLKFGRLDSRKMVRGMVNEDPHIFKKNLIEKGKNEIVIALLIDQSGSMHGDKIVNAQKAAILFGEVLHSLDLNFSIYGWTDISFGDTRYYPYIRRAGVSLPKWRPVTFPPTINQEVFTVFCYKEFSENYTNCKNKLGMIHALCDNSDHNAIEYITQKLLKTKKRVKILMVLSDGQPAAISYEFISSRLSGTYPSGRFNYGRGNIGINVTRQAIEHAQKLGIQTICVSIDSAKNYQEQIYGANNFIVVNPQKIQELPVKVAKVLSLLLRRAGVKF